MTPEEHLIQRYLNAFNRHDIEGVMACFHDHTLVIDAQGHHIAGQDAVRRYYETSFALFPDGRCDLACSPAMMARVWQSPSFMAADRRRAKSLRRVAQKS